MAGCSCLHSRRDTSASEDDPRGDDGTRHRGAGAAGRARRVGRFGARRDGGPGVAHPAGSPRLLLHHQEQHPGGCHRGAARSGPGARWSVVASRAGRRHHRDHRDRSGALRAPAAPAAPRGGELGRRQDAPHARPASGRARLGRGRPPTAGGVARCAGRAGLARGVAGRDPGRRCSDRLVSLPVPRRRCQGRALGGAHLSRGDGALPPPVRRATGPGPPIQTGHSTSVASPPTMVAVSTTRSPGMGHSS